MGEFGLYIKVPMENGHEFLAEADTGGQGVVRATRGESVVKSSVETFEGSLSRVREIAEVILDKLSGLPSAPDRIRAEFGVSLDVEAGVAVVKGTAGAHFVIDLEWSRKPEE
jgi:hypothetical protein